MNSQIRKLKHFQVSYLSNEKKKVINIFIAVDQSITCLEDLTNEIFDYLNGGEIVDTFFKLNSRFEQLFL